MFFFLNFEDPRAFDLSAAVEQSRAAESRRVNAIDELQKFIDENNEQVNTNKRNISFYFYQKFYFYQIFFSTRMFMMYLRTGLVYFTASHTN